MKTTEVQLRIRSRVLDTKKGKALTFGFQLGPMAFFIIANVPEKLDNKATALAYVKLNLRLENDWEDSTIEEEG